MIYNFTNSDKKPCAFKVQLTANGKEPMPIAIAVYNALNKKAIYTLSVTNIQGTRTVEVRLPVSPEKGVISIWRVNAESDYDKDLGFSVDNISRVDLTQDLKSISHDKHLMNFIKFAEDFAEKASWLSAGDKENRHSVYKSDDGKFVIFYTDEIIGEDGKPRKTSMRVNNKKGWMELAKKYVVGYTIPEIVAILLHEYSHLWKNRVHSDEFEADLNALKIYCALGFPKKEGASGFYKVFYRTDSDLNIERMRRIRNFLKNYERTNFKTAA